LFCCKPSNEKISHEIVEKRTNEIFDSLIKVRRDLHKHPELSGQEERTSKIIAEYLSNLGLEVKTGIAGYGVVGILKGGKEGRKIAWRADMDALQIDVNDKVSFKSQNKGIAHMCGHDVHTAIGLGIANVLANQRENIKGTIYFIFQPSEETFKGAKAMIDDDLFDMIKPDEIYGAHIFPSKAGVIGIKAGELFAYEKTIKVEFKSNDTENELKSLLSSIMQGLSRSKPNSKPWQLESITDSIIGLENPETIYKDYLIVLPNIRTSKEQNNIVLETTFFETNKNNLDSIPQIIKDRIFETKHKSSFISIEYSRGNPTVFNDTDLTKKAIKLLNKVYDNKSIKQIYGQVPYFNEDFIYYQQKVPGVFFFLGGSDFENDLIAMPHSPDFAVDEKAIKFGVKSFSSLILERTNNE